MIKYVDKGENNEVKLISITCFLMLLFSNSLLWAQTPPSSQAGKKGEPRGTKPLLTISGRADLTSHFISRGLSMSDNNPALNALFLLHMGSQFKFGIWGSNISQVDNPDDNFWFKFVGEIKIDVNANTTMDLYLHDNRFYKSDIRNGQNLGAKIIGLKKFITTVELSNNLEGSKTASEYVSVGYIHQLPFDAKWIATGTVGFTHSRAAGVYDYIDIRIETSYQAMKYLEGYIGGTITTDWSQLHGRGKPFLNAGIRFSY